MPPRNEIPGGPAAPGATCPQCHKDLPGEFAFCPHCGNRITKA
ncbi:MAG: zinc-ribbon domain-containing protein [Desulfobaccales bacterium]